MALVSDSTVLAELLAPTPIDAFVRRDWDRAPLLGRGDRLSSGEGAARWSRWFSEDALDKLVAEGGLAAPSVRLARGEEVVRRDSWGIGRLPWGTGSVAGFARPERVFDLMGSGFSLTVDAADRHWPALAELCSSLREETAADVRCAVHRAPAGEAASEPARYEPGHRFVLQVGGARRWQVFAPDGDRPQRLEPCPPQGGTPGESLLEARLGEGDLLYVPRGFWAQQAAVAEAASLAVVLTVQPFTWRDLLLAVARRLDASDGGPAVRVNSRQAVSLSEPQVDWLDEQVEELLLQHDVAAAVTELVDASGPRLPLSAGLSRSSSADDTEASP